MLTLADDAILFAGLVGAEYGTRTYNGQKIPCIGVLWVFRDKYLIKCLQAGHKVALMENVLDNVVSVEIKRDIVRITDANIFEL
jgi:DNA mismatch repair ATPase MutS